MKCSSHLLLSVLGLAGASSIVKECNSNGQVALIVDGLTKQDGPKLLKTLATEKISALIAVPQTMLVGKDHFELLDDAKKAGHELGYRVHIADNVQLANVTDDQLVDEIKEAKTRIHDIHQANISYVIFPYSKDTNVEKRFARVAERAGMTAVGHSLYLGPKDKDAKAAILQNIYDAKNISYIALLEGNSQHDDTIKYYKQQVIKHNFTLVPMSKCLSGPKAAPRGVLKKHIDVEHFEKNNNHNHGRRHRKHRLVKKGVLVNPKYIKGYEKLRAKMHRENENDKPADSNKENVHDGVKMHAKAGKDFDLHEQKPIDLKGPMNAHKNEDKKDEKNEKKDEKKDEKKEGVDKAGAKGKNAGVNLTAGTTTMVLAAVVGLVALF